MKADFVMQQNRRLGISPSLCYGAVVSVPHRLRGPSTTRLRVLPDPKIEESVGLQAYVTATQHEIQIVEGIVFATLGGCALLGVIMAFCL